MYYVRKKLRNVQRNSSLAPHLALNHGYSQSRSAVQVSPHAPLIKLAALKVYQTVEEWNFYSHQSITTISRFHATTRLLY